MKSLGAPLVFFAELGMLAGLALWGWHVGQGPMRIVLAVVLPLAVATVWGMFLAPKASKPLRPRVLAIVVRLDLLLLGAAAAWGAGVTWLAIATAVMAVVGTVLAWAGEGSSSAALGGPARGDDTRG